MNASSHLEKNRRRPDVAAGSPALTSQSVVTASASAQEQPPAVEIPQRRTCRRARRREFLHPAATSGS